MWVATGTGELVNLSNYDDVVHETGGVVATRTKGGDLIEIRMLFKSNVVGKENKAFEKVKLGLSTNQPFISLEEI